VSNQLSNYGGVQTGTHPGDRGASRRSISTQGRPPGLLHTEEVTGSNPVSPTSSIPTQQRAVAPRTDLPRSVCLRLAAGRFARPGSDNATSARRCVHPLGRAEHLLHTISRKRRQPRPSSQLYGIRVPQAVHHSEAARRPRVVVALHSDHCRRRPDLGYLRE
jgi:hypothetical protein